MIVWKFWLALGCVLSSETLFKGVLGQETTLTVAVMEDAPFVTSSDDGYVGFIPDMLTEIAKGLNVNWDFTEIEGSYAEAQEEILSEVENENIDMAAVAIGITAEREASVAFTKPFMVYGITTIIKKPQQSYRARLFAYIRPFTAAVWIVFLLCTIGTGLLLYLVNRFHPKETAGVANRVSIGGEGKRLADSYWWICRSAVLQGVESRPRSIAGRIVAVVWIVFVLDSIFIYLAALIHNMPLYYGPAASTSSVSLDNIINEDLHTFVVVNGSNAHKFFAQSQVDIYEKVNASMNLVSSVSEAIESVKSDNAALFIDSPYADYYTGQDCDLTTVGGNLNARGYGLALPRDSALLGQISMEVLGLQENGKLNQLVKKWFMTSDCKAKVEAAETSLPVEVKVGMDGFGGPVILLILGMLVALVVAMLETLLVQRRSKSYNVEDTKDPEKQPMLNSTEEEGQAVQYDNNDSAEGKEVKEDTAEKEEKKEDAEDDKKPAEEEKEKAESAEDEVKAEEEKKVDEEPVKKEDEPEVQAEKPAEKPADEKEQEPEEKQVGEIKEVDKDEEPKKEPAKDDDKEEDTKTEETKDEKAQEDDSEKKEEADEKDDPNKSVVI